MTDPRLCPIKDTDLNGIVVHGTYACRKCKKDDIRLTRIVNKWKHPNYLPLTWKVFMDLSKRIIQFYDLVSDAIQDLLAEFRCHIHEHIKYHIVCNCSKLWDCPECRRDKIIFQSTVWGVDFVIPLNGDKLNAVRWRRQGLALIETYDFCQTRLLQHFIQLSWIKIINHNAQLNLPFLFASITFLFPWII